MHFGVQHGWLWSAVLGVMIGYFARETGITSAILIAWLVLALGMAGARVLRFAFEEPQWWVDQVRAKGVGAVAWNTVRGVLYFAATYAVIMAVAGLLALVL
jgi:hypothetical protein